MIRHPLTLQHIANELHARLVGAVLVTAWTQEKDVATLGFVLPNTSELYVQLNVSASYGTVLTSTSSTRAKRNSMPLFDMLYGKALVAVRREEGDRIISFDFPSLTLRAMFFSGGSGNIVIVQHEVVVSALHNQKQLKGLRLSIHRKPLQLGKYLAAEEELQPMAAERYAASQLFYVLEREEQYLFSALPLHGWTVLETSADIFMALRHTIALRSRQVRVSTSTLEARNRVTAELAKAERSLQAMDAAAEKSKQPEQLRQLGTELLSKSAPTPEDIENAQKLFEAARKATKAAKERMQRRPTLVDKIQRLKLQLTNLENGVLPEPETKSQQPTLPYRTFELEEGYVLYVGKNSANNDQLTMRFAKQNDYWFHVRGQSGSHCVLRAPQSKVGKIPKRILEQAAAIAAYYSSARNASWTPVVYTLRKYVRKPKGAAVGAVTLDREEVVMVKPALPIGQSEQE